jgi:5-methylcytosine-specific restriction endonuclease McrA
MTTVTYKTLLLNASYEPLCFINVRRAVRLLFLGKIEIISSWDALLRSMKSSINIPAVIRLRHRVDAGNHPVKFSRVLLFHRDGWKCQYCGRRLDCSTATIDHYVPKSQGGKTTWTNCTTACKVCNGSKGSLNPKLVPRPLHKLYPPRNMVVGAGLHGGEKWHPDWVFYVGERVLNS